MIKNDTNKGLIKAIILIVIALIILGYFGLNLRNIINSPTVQDNFAYAEGLIVNIWNNYLSRPAAYLWNNVFIDLIWNPAISNLERMKSGGAVVPENVAPTVPKPASPLVK